MGKNSIKELGDYVDEKDFMNLLFMNDKDSRMYFKVQKIRRELKLDNLGFAVNKTPEYTFNRTTKDLIHNIETINDINIEFDNSIIADQHNHGFRVGDIIMDDNKNYLYIKADREMWENINFKGYRVTKVLDKDTFVSEEI